MRYACCVISALLAMIWVGTIGVGQGAESKAAAVAKDAEELQIEAPAAPEEGTLGEAAEPAPPAVSAEEMRKNVVERLAEARKDWLGRARVALGVESDDDWAKMEPLILRLEQLERIRDFMRQKGQVLFYAQAVSGEELMTGAEQMQQQFTSFNPDLPESDFKQLSAAHAALVGAFHNKDATEEQVNEALGAWRQAAAELDAKVDQAAAQLAQTATPRQQAGLMLMGIVDAAAMALPKEISRSAASISSLPPAAP